MNNKGFTMIELLASMVLLSVLMIVAVPTVLRVMDDSRRTTLVNDSKKLVSSVEYKINNNNNYIIRPRYQNYCILLTLGYLDLGSEFKEGPHGGTYSLDDSFVVVKLKGYGNASTGDVQTYDYYVTLVENYDGNANYGLYMVSLDELNSRNAKGYVNGLPKDKLFSKKENNPNTLDKNVDLAGGNGKKLGCFNDLKNNSTNKNLDYVYDSNDALREQGVEVSD